MFTTKVEMLLGKVSFMFSEKWDGILQPEPSMKVFSEKI